MFLNEINAGSDLGTKNSRKVEINSFADSYEKGTSFLFCSNHLRPSSIMRMKEYKIFKSFISELSIQYKRDGFILQNEKSNDSKISYDLCSRNNPSDYDKDSQLSDDDVASKHIRFYDGDTGVSMHWYPFDLCCDKVLELATHEIDESKENQNELDYRSSTEGIFFNSNLEELTKGTSMDELSLSEFFSDNFELWRDNVEKLLTQDEQKLFPRIIRLIETQLESIDSAYLYVTNYFRVLRMKIRYKISDYKDLLLNSSILTFPSNKKEVK